MINQNRGLTKEREFVIVCLRKCHFAKLPTV
nr:MAG TPA: hypothetical protein [Inoviridae sp.]